ncbi:MAG TPA: hypothetical protein VGO11_16330 [Chthoniobacteraceae bacterium]|jgi:hypothetical protein|nr:hypothetical protein [Chthoniobacteraceae bacterium]
MKKNRSFSQWPALSGLLLSLAGLPAIAGPADDFRAAANAGNSAALVGLGSCYEHGTGGEEVNLSLAASCYAAGAQRGSEEARFQLALCYAAGVGVAQDAGLALRLLRTGAQAGYAPAQRALARGWRGEFDYMRRITTVSPLLGEEATRFFQATSGEYRLRNAPFPETPSAETWERTARGTDPALAALGQAWQELGRQCGQRQEKSALVRQAEAATQQRMQWNFLSYLFLEENTLGNASRFLDRSLGNDGRLGSDLQATLNDLWNCELQIQTGFTEYRGKVRDYARSHAGATAAQPGALAVRMTLQGLSQAGLAVTNRTGTTLNHCLLVSRELPDKGRIFRDAAGNELLAGVLNPLAGVPEERTQAGNRGGELQARIAACEHGSVAYVPVLLAGETVEIPLCAPSFLAGGPRVDVALWSDELQSESAPAANFAEMQAAFERMRDQWIKQQQQQQQQSAGRPSPSTQTFGSAPRPFDNPLNHPAKRVTRGVGMP